ncbi:MAG: hypothetical protein IPM12_00495 [Flavobacteriales bacterium]|nr:hypothetical protein [Flavobacteriales bacterium]
MRPRTALLLAALAGSAALIAQTASFDWSDAPAWDPSWEEGRTIDSEILADELSLRIRNVKPEYISFFFERRRVVRFTEREDIKRYGAVVMPESLDPPYDELGKPYARLDTRPYPLLFNLRVDHFAARVIRPDGSWTELPVTMRSARGYSGHPVSFQATMAETHYPQGIMPGDVVEYRWKYMLPWDTNAPHTLGWRGSIWMDNWARLTNWRIFFHHGLPIREQRIELLYHAKHGLEMAGAVPVHREHDGNVRRAVWEHRDLPGVMDEAGARPAEELPCIIVAFAPDDLRNLRRERLSNLPITQQPWLQAIRQREAKAMWWRRVAQTKLPDRQNRQIKGFIRETCAGIPDTLKARRMEALHKRIARDFTYDADRDWYFDLDRSLARMGDQVRDERLRDISRYDLYSKLLNAEGNDHVTAYLLDKRSGRLDDRFTTPMRDNEWLFGIGDGTGMLWMHPKRQRHGWFANELPFYWEGSNALLIDLQRLIADDPSPPLFVELPTGDPAANVRAMEHRLRIDLDKADAAGDARILLSGQFSTLGRAAFLGDRIDSTVHPSYGHSPAHLPQAALIGSSDRGLQSDPPFRFRERQELAIAQWVTPEADGLFAMELRPFFAHAVAEGFRAESRDLPFHWDFRQSDRFIIDLEFTQPVEVMDLTALQGEWNCPSARYTLRATRIDARHVRIESLLQVSDETEHPEDALALETLLREVLAPSRVLRVRVNMEPEP